MAKNTSSPRLDIFKSFLKTDAKKAFVTIFNDHKGDWSKMIEPLNNHELLKDMVNVKEDDKVPNLSFINQLAELSNEHLDVVKAFVENPKTNSLRDIALNYGKTELMDLVEKAGVPAVLETPVPTVFDTPVPTVFVRPVPTVFDTPVPAVSDNTPVSDASPSSKEDLVAKQANYVQAMSNYLFAQEPTAVVQRMVETAAIPTMSDVGIIKLLTNQYIESIKDKTEAFNIKTTSVYEIIKNDKFFTGIPVKQHDSIKTELKTLQRVAAISPVAEAIPVLMKANMHTAFQVSDMPESQFVTAFKGQLGDNGEDIARQLHINATNTRIRNEHALMALKEVAQGTGIAFIDKSLNFVEKLPTPMSGIAPKDPTLEETAKATFAKHNLSWDLLFGDADLCECGACTSVYSAASYFVELMNYLRNNNLDPNAIGIVARKADPRDISGTPLEKLLARRPDLGCLELTCKNTNTILPYVDLVNEVMENYVVSKKPKPFNVADETSGELLAEPQHTEYKAYCILKNEVYPFTLPYHQPIDQARIDLDFLGTSRTELMDVFRSPLKTPPPPNQDDCDKNNLNAENIAVNLLNTDDTLHKDYLDRAVDAEYLGLTQEEYVILTKEHFVSKKYWELLSGKAQPDTIENYQSAIGVKDKWAYYGYATEGDMLDATTEKGLTYVKKQFLLRTGIQYTDLVELLLTECLNPNLPRGKMKFITEQIHFSYRYLQAFKAAHGEDELIQLLTNPAQLVQALPELADFVTLLDSNQANVRSVCPNPNEEKMLILDKDIQHWVKCHFEKIGQMIVLENGGTSSCIEGTFYDFNQQAYGDLNNLGFGILTINTKDNVVFTKRKDQSDISIIVGKYDCITGEVTITYDGTSIGEIQKYRPEFRTSGGLKGVWKDNTIVEEKTGVPFSSIIQSKDTCDLDTVRLIHLDGSEVTVEEYDHIQRFIRLWRKMGWTIDEIDKALMGLSSLKNTANVIALPKEADGSKQLIDTKDDCKDCKDTASGCGDSSAVMSAQCNITPAFLHQLVAVKKLLDKTGLELIKLLTFWTKISTSGEKSLYKRLFLTHNLLGKDKTLKTYADNNFSAQAAKISEHEPVIMAALNLSSDDIEAIIKNKYPLINSETYVSKYGKELTDIIKTELLTLENLSLMYRYRLLSKALGLKIPDFIDMLLLFNDPFADAHTTFKFMERWGRMEDAGFNYRQLNYIIKDHDDPKKPLAPKEKTILQLAKTLFDGLNAIDEAHKDLPPLTNTTDKEQQKLEIILQQSQATSEIVRSKAALLFDPSVVDQITSILEGTSVFLTNAPTATNVITEIRVKLDPQQDKPAAPASPDLVSLRKKIKYTSSIDLPHPNNNKASIQVTGILTTTETAELKTWSNDPDWNGTGPKPMLYRIERQQNKLFKTVLLDIFNLENAKAAKDNAALRLTALATAETTIIEGDINIDGQHDTNTAAQKRVQFLTVFLPYLRDELTHRFVVNTLSNLVGLDSKITDVLISEVLMLGNPLMPIYKVFEKIKNSAKPSANDWQGYLIPSAEGEFTFIIKNTTNLPVLNIEGITFFVWEQQDDPNNEWWAKTPVKLEAGKLYKLNLTGPNATNLYWKTATSAIAAVPPALLLPDFASADCTPAFILLKKAALLVSGFALGKDEIQYFNAHKAAFGNLDFDFENKKFTLEHWLRLEAYTRLRNSLPESKTNILAFFNWTTTVWATVAQEQVEKAKLSEKIAELTLWKKERIDKLIAAEHFNLNDVTKFNYEVNLLKLQKAIGVADKIGIDINLLFDWAKPTSNFDKCRVIADSIDKAIRAQYKQTDWETIIKPLTDKLRNNQKDALIAYLLQQPDLKKWGVIDADGLYEYFLIDVQMDACMETSRIVQAIAAVQLFVMRCFLGLEEEHNGIKPTTLDRPRWEWMERYRVWEANRKVFLYPENWIESNLRDDKSPFFKELESELLQKDINKQNVTDALKAYLYKVDEVANMEVIGLYIDGNKNTDGRWNVGAKLHVFSRTRNAPYFFYYRYLALDEMNWYAWEKMQVDIPSYDFEDETPTDVDGKNVKVKNSTTGCYMTPIVWNGRLFVFFPQFMKKTKPVSNKITVPGAGGEMTLEQPIEYWEIKMAWSEYRNGKWTQKQLSHNSVSSSQLFPIEKYKFIPSINDNSVLISVEDEIDNDGWVYSFEFEGSKISYIALQKLNGLPTTLSTLLDTPSGNKNLPNFFHKKLLTIALRGDKGKMHLAPMVIEKGAWKGGYDNNQTGVYSDDKFNTQIISTSDNSIDFYYPYTHDLLGKINTGQLEDFFKYNLSIKDNNTPDKKKADAFGEHGVNNYHELKRPYSLYNWELFFHTPMMLADALSKAQQFEEAMKWYHFVFNPLGNPDPSVIDNSDTRFWQFSPFKDINSQRILDSIFNHLQPNQTDEAINTWRNHPFMPHSVARDRPVAYMKWVVMKYIDNLVAWGDYLFRQFTRESINQSTQLYVLASHILGKRPMLIPKRGKIKPQTYLSLLDKWDAFGNAMVELELVAPYSNQITTPLGNANGVVGFANVFGFSTTLYFCIPNNPKLMGYWDTIADRLFKIRHCQDIEGIVRKLPLFDPPIDPALLVKAAAQGLSIASVLNDLNTALPNYRFYYLLQKALELCNELKSLGGALLSAIEKKDNEAIALMRSRHENALLNLVMDVKTQQLEEAQKSLETLQQNRIAPVERMKYYLKLSGTDESSVPSETAGFTGLTNDIEGAVEDSGLKVSKYEKSEMDWAFAGFTAQIAAGVSKTLAGIITPIPDLHIYAAPFGVGATTQATGGQKLGKALEIASDVIGVGSTVFSYQSANAGKKGGYQRALQERIQQANAAGYEIKQIDKQITAQQIRFNIANQEITNQQKQIDNAQEVEDFLINKYTNVELYTWMRGSLKTLYHQVYNLAYDLAKKAEKTYRFERGLSNSNFIQSGYWDSGRDGLLAGEQLYVGLKQLEAAYQENRGYDYEITKHISLRQINPIAVLQLKETGKCEFVLPEVLFDMDFPGHFKRRIKSVSLSIPCVAGPYTNINGTLRLLENKFRNTAIGGKTYAENTEDTDERFSTYIIPISAIAASSAQNDSGMFELNFKDERYLPFEGAGVTSKWRLELPQFRQFDYETISDVVVHLRYMSNEGGERLKSAASGSVTNFMKSVEELGQQEGLFTIIDLQHDLTTEWHKIGADNKLAISIKKGNFQYFAQNKTITITNCRYFNNGNLAGGGVEATITPPQTNVLIAHDTSTIPNITIADKDKGFHYLVIRFTLG